MNLYGPTAIALPPGKTLVAGCGREHKEHTSMPHCHPEGQLLGSRRGLLTIGTETGMWVVPATHAVWIPPHQIHWARSHGPLDGWTVYVAERARQQLPLTVRTIRASGLLREAVLRAATWPAGPADTAVDRHICEVILDEIEGLPTDSFTLPLPSDHQALHVAQALIADPGDPRGIRDWASLVSVSDRTLSRRFVDQTGFTFSGWRQRARLVRSLEMLAEQQPVTSIALNLGYATASAFIALFRRTFGESPASYRAKLIDPTPSPT
ncbi:AraC family transcriptional regulator [Mycolicibacterium komossense]|uniref:Helix-turn-helix transcriptional regulator n=1 Tax=Mycolicibacterium komossense TaxID=1779 RepID=A0ABT3CF20_9MYCO|nr:helix-turn-helix transcriptional regulator [Mycolicibacterium komossense]